MEIPCECGDEHANGHCVSCLCETCTAPTPVSDREYLRNLATQNGWEWGALPDDGLARVVRGDVTIWFWFVHNNHDELNCAEASNWKRESYGPPALRRAMREMRTKVPA